MSTVPYFDEDYSSGSYYYGPIENVIFNPGGLSDSRKSTLHNLAIKMINGGGLGDVPNLNSAEMEFLVNQYNELRKGE